MCAWSWNPSARTWRPATINGRARRATGRSRRSRNRDGWALSQTSRGTKARRTGGRSVSSPKVCASTRKAERWCFGGRLNSLRAIVGLWPSMERYLSIGRIGPRRRFSMGECAGSRRPRNRPRRQVPPRLTRLWQALNRCAVFLSQAPGNCANWWQTGTSRPSPAQRAAMRSGQASTRSKPRGWNSPSRGCIPSPRAGALRERFGSACNLLHRLQRRLRRWRSV